MAGILSRVRPHGPEVSEHVTQHEDTPLSHNSESVDLPVHFTAKHCCTRMRMHYVCLGGSAPSTAVGSHLRQQRCPAVLRHLTVHYHLHVPSTMDVHGTVSVLCVRMRDALNRTTVRIQRSTCARPERSYPPLLECDSFAKYSITHEVPDCIKYGTVAAWSVL